MPTASGRLSRISIDKTASCKWAAVLHPGSAEHGVMPSEAAITWRHQNLAKDCHVGGA